MDFDKYKEDALEVKLYHEQQITPLFSKLSYLFMGLSGEVGELGEKLKKIIRDNDCIITPEVSLLLQKELGDCLWYWTAIVEELGFSANEIASLNLEKIKDRIERDCLGGSGDER